MPRIINDQLRNRSDLSPGQKFRLRHPEYFQRSEFKSAHAAYERVRRLHSDDPNKAQRKYEKKKKLERISTAIATVSRVVTNGQQGVFAAKRREIVKIFQRGNSIESIAVWMNIPVSAVQAVVRAHLSNLVVEPRQNSDKHVP